MADDINLPKVLNLISDAELALALNVFYSAGTEPLVIPYAVNRSALWQLLISGNSTQLERAKTNGLVLVWDQPGYLPDSVGTVKTGEYLNPLVWCACALNKFPGLKIAVIDHDPVGHSGYGFYKTIQALNPENIGLRVFPVPVLLKKCVAALTAEPAKSSNQTVDILIRHISTLLTEHGDENNHHELASIIGPLVHMRRMGKVFGEGETKDLLEERRELLSLFEAVGLIEWAEEKTNPEPLEIESMKLVLIDDHADHGWAEWLRAGVKGTEEERRKRILVASTSDDFYSFLEKCTRTDAERTVKDRRFNLILPECEKTDSSALLLDIHLFHKNSDLEKKFFAKLVDLVDVWGFTGPGLAWDAIPEGEVKAVRAWATSCGRRPADEVLLTIFPRFLALLDPSLPIVIFSTTLQHPLIGKLKKYGNIFTGLNKNPFAGAEPPLDYLRDNLPTLRAYNKLRKRFAELESLPPIPKADDRFKHWEIYIDESGTPENNFFLVAGLLVGYETEKEAQDIHQAMQESGLSWNEDFGDYIWLNGQSKSLRKARNYPEKNDYGLNKQWESISKKMESVTSGLKKYSFCLLTKFRDGSQIDKGSFEQPRLCNPDSLDNLYFSLLGDLFEAALFDVLAKVNNNSSPTVSVFAASRLRVYKGKNADIENIRKRYAAFGVSLYEKPDTKEPAFQALQMSGLLPVVSELLEMRAGHEFGGELHTGMRAVAVIPMSSSARNDDGSARFEDNRLRFPPYRHMHFMADIMASLAAKNNSSDYGVMTKSTFGFGENDVNKALFARRESDFEGFSCLQRISRSLDARDKNIIHASFLFSQMSQSVKDISRAGIFAQVVLERLRDALKTDLTGVQLHQLALASPGALSVIGAMKAAEDRFAELKKRIAGLERKLTECNGKTESARPDAASLLSKFVSRNNPPHNNP